MKLKGIVTGVIRDVNTGEIKRTFTEENHVQDWWFARAADIYSWNSIYRLGGTDDNIFVSETDFGVQRRDVEYIGLSTIGEVQPGVTSPTYSYFQPGALHLKEFQMVFTPPAADRDINTIGVTSTRTNETIYTNNSTVRGDAWVALTSPCTQTTTESLTVFYRLQLIYDENSFDPSFGADETRLNEYESFRVAQQLFEGLDPPIADGNAAGTTVANYGYFCCQKWNPRRNNTALITNLAAEIEQVNGVPFTYLQHQPDYFKTLHTWSMDTNDSIGRVIGTMYFFGAYGRNIFENQTFSPIQNVFGHDSSADKPFYDPTAIQSGAGTLTFDGSGWTNPDYPKLLRINVTTTGGVGVGEYKIQQRNQFGFNLNTYDNMVHQIPAFAFPNAHYFDDFRVIRNTFDTVSTVETYQIATMIRYDDTTVVAGWIDEIAIIDVLTGEGKRFASDTTPAMPLLSVGQMAVKESNGDTWVADRVNGLYKVNAAQTTVTLYDSSSSGLTGVTGCYAVEIGFGGRIWAFFDGTTPGLYYSDNDGTSWTNVAFSQTDIDADPTLVFCIQADPSEADHHVAVGYRDDTTGTNTDLYICWWDGTGVVAPGGAAAAGPLFAKIYGSNGSSFTYERGRYVDKLEPVTYFNWFSCSPNDGYWGTACHTTSTTQDEGDAALFTFGAATIQTAGGTNNGPRSPFAWGWGTDDNGDDAIFYLSSRNGVSSSDNYAFVGMFRASNVTLEFEDTNTAQGFYNYQPFGNSQVYMGNGVWLGWVAPSNGGNRDGSVYIMAPQPNAFPDGGAFKNELFPEYGWTGAAWVKGNAGSKTFHAASEALLDGINVSFDDDGGADTFDSPDYYTVGIVDGIQLDGATTWEHTMDIYTKPTISDETAIESATIPGAAQSPPALEQFVYNTPNPLPGQFQDAVLMDFNNGDAVLEKDVNSATNVYDAGLRSLDPTVTDTTMTGPVTVNGVTDVQGYLEFRFDAPSGATSVFQGVVGLSSSAVLGNAIDPATIEFAIKYDTEATVANPTTTTNGQISILESGVTVATFPDDWAGYLTTNPDDSYMQIFIKTDGSVVYQGYTALNGFHVFHTSPPGTATIQDYYLDCAFAGTQNSGIRLVTGYRPFDPSDFLALSDGIGGGASNPEFISVDPDYAIINIGGSEAINVGLNDNTTTLLTGEYSLFPQDGLIRYSPADAGQTVSAEYTIIVHE